MTSLCFMAIALFGLFSFSKLPIDLMPDIETNTIMVFTYYNGASAADIENNVSRPLENTLNSVEHLKHITSNSRENVSVITLEFEVGYDIDDLTNDVRDKLDMVASALPDDANNPIIFKFSTDMIPIMMLSVKAEESQAALYKILDDNVVNPLARIDGVGTVSISGAPEREINVYMDPAKMEAYNIPIESVSAAIGAENRNIPGGTFDIGNNTYSLRVEGEFSDPREMYDIVVGNFNGVNVFLKDVATIHDNVQERAQETYTDGQQGAMIIIQKQSGGNSVAIANAVRDALPELQKRLPSDVKIGVIADTSENILMTVDTLSGTIMDALVFVVLVVFIFLGRWRATIIVAITIPFSLIASFIYLFVTDGSINMISLSCLSIAIGSVVDDAIVVIPRAEGRWRSAQGRQGLQARRLRPRRRSASADGGETAPRGTRHQGGRPHRQDSEDPLRGYGHHAFAHLPPAQRGRTALLSGGPRPPRQRHPARAPLRQHGTLRADDGKCCRPHPGHPRGGAQEGRVHVPRLVLDLGP